jgi:hypothetical protein
VPHGARIQKATTWRGRDPAEPRESRISDALNLDVGQVVLLRRLGQRSIWNHARRRLMKGARGRLPERPAN